MGNRIEEKTDELRKELALIEEDVVTNYTLADAIREGSKVTDKAEGWGNGNDACALSAGFLAVKARGFLDK